MAKTVAQDFWEMGTNYTLKNNDKSLWYGTRYVITLAVIFSNW